MRTTPIISKPIPKEDPLRGIKLGENDVKKYLQRKKVPITKKSKQRAARFLKRRKYLNSLPKAKEITISQSDAPWTVGYGQFRIGGFLTFMHEAGPLKQFLYFVSTILCHEIDSLVSIYVDGNQVQFGLPFGVEFINATGGAKPDGTSIDYTDLISVAVNLGAEDQTALDDFVWLLPGFWTENHRQRGCAHIGVRCQYNAEKFPNDSPETVFEVRGKRVYDPRTSTWIYTSNAALVIADYITNTKFGLGEHFTFADHIDSTSLIAAANVCDEVVSTASGGTEYRYTIDGHFATDQDPNDILSDMESAMAGFITYTPDGKWKFWPGVYRTPTVTLTDDDLRGEPEIEVLAPEAEVFNSVRGSYSARAKGYEVTDYPAVTVAGYVTADNGKRLWGDIDLPFTVSTSAAQRIGRFYLERSRRQFRIKCEWGLRALQLEVGDTVTIELERYGTSAVFEVQEWDLLVDSDGACVVAMDLQSTDTGIDNWVPGTDEQVISVPPITTLPDLNRIPLPVLTTAESGTEHLYRRLDGTIMTRIYVAWEDPEDIYIAQGGYVEIQFKRSSDASWQFAPSVSGDATFTYLTDVLDGVAYDIGIKFVNAIGVKSDFVAVYGVIVIGKTEPPSSVTGFASSINDSGIQLNWNQIVDADRAGYEIRRGASFSAGELVGRPRADGPGSFLYQFFTSGAHTLWIKSFDTTGNPSTTASSITVVIAQPNPVQGLTISTIRNNVLIDWRQPAASTFSVDKYEIRKGDILGTAELVGTVFGTFHTYMEKYAGTFRYWVIPIDRGGNRGDARSVLCTVSANNDFFINDDQDLLPSVESMTYAVEVDEAIYAPYGGNPVQGMLWSLMLNGETRQTWKQHFETNGWDTIENAAVSYTTYLQPSAAGVDAVMIFEVDYGLVLPSASIDFTWRETPLNDGAESLITAAEISLSEDGSTWEDYEGDRIFAYSFRYARYKLTTAASSDQAISRFDAFRAILFLERDYETQVVDALSTDVTGTRVYLTEEFIDVEDIQVSVNSTTEAKAVFDYDFEVVPAQDYLDVYVFGPEGDRISKQVTVRVAGAIGG